MQIKTALYCLVLLAFSHPFKGLAQADAGIPFLNFSTASKPCLDKSAGDRCDSWYEAKRTCKEERKEFERRFFRIYDRRSEEACRILEEKGEALIVSCLHCSKVEVEESQKEVAKGAEK